MLEYFKLTRGAGRPLVLYSAVTRASLFTVKLPGLRASTVELPGQEWYCTVTR